MTEKTAEKPRSYSRDDMDMHTRLALLEHDKKRSDAMMEQLAKTTKSIEQSIAEMVVIEKHNSQRHNETMEALGRAFTQIEAEREARQDALEKESDARLRLKSRIDLWAGGLTMLVFVIGLGSRFV